MSLDLSTLALYARASPAANISIDTGPNEAGGDQFLSCSDAGVRESMQGVEDSASPREWN